jgi:hypothetical protein
MLGIAVMMAVTDARTVQGTLSDSGRSDEDSDKKEMSGRLKLMMQARWEVNALNEPL